MKKISLLLPMLFVIFVSTAVAKIQISFSSENEGLTFLIDEIAAISDMVDEVDKTNKLPGRHQINYAKIKADLNRIKNGLIAARERPIDQRVRIQSAQKKLKKKGEYFNE